MNESQKTPCEKEVNELKEKKDNLGQIKCMLCKHGDLHVDPQYLCKGQAGIKTTCSFSIGELDIDSWGNLN